MKRILVEKISKKLKDHKLRESTEKEPRKLNEKEIRNIIEKIASEQYLKPFKERVDKD
jgi:hypothetical protein